MKKEKYFLVEQDDNGIIHLKANSKKEMKEKLFKFFVKEGFCDTFIMTESEYKQYIYDLKEIKNEERE